MFRSEISGDPALKTLIMNYQIVIRDNENYCETSDPLSQVIFSFYAMKSAYLIVKLLREENIYPGESSLLARNLGDAPVDKTQMPRLSTVLSNSNSILNAFESGDRASLLRLLGEIGVFEFCPNADEQLQRMRRFSKFVNGNARIVLLVELVLFACELRDYDAMRGFLLESWEWKPDGWELYNLYIGEGLLSLDSGDWEAAISCLEKSTDACLTDGKTAQRCGLRAPNFRLADGLLKAGYELPVLKHLTECQDIWRLGWMPMRNWIKIIEGGAIPDLLDSPTVASMNLPSCRLYLQWLRARTLDADHPVANVPRSVGSRREVTDERMRLAEDGKKLLSEGIKEWLTREVEGDLAEPGQPE